MIHVRAPAPAIAFRDDFLDPLNIIGFAVKARALLVLVHYIPEVLELFAARVAFESVNGHIILPSYYKDTKNLRGLQFFYEFCFSGHPPKNTPSV
jgi:hypothetical protein